MSSHHVPNVSCVNLQRQFFFNVLISCHGRFKATKKRVCVCLQTIKANMLERRYQSSIDMRFRQAG